MEYIDLGLSSGTLWSESNEEGLYTFDEAVEKYGNDIPTWEQFKELQTQCQWEWTGDGYKVTGPNGNTIFLPADGYRYLDGNMYREGSIGDYWSSTPDGSDFAWSLTFHSCVEYVSIVDRHYGMSVRLVKTKDNTGNKELNIAAILKDCPKGTKLYSPLFGEVEFYSVENNEDMNICNIVVLDPQNLSYSNEELKDLSRVSFSSDGRWFCGRGECMLFPSKENRDWSTFNAPKKEYEFKPFEKVLVRDTDINCWTAGLFSHILHDDNSEYRYAVSGIYYKMCIPYKGNEHLIGTTDSPDEKGGVE